MKYNEEKYNELDIIFWTGQIAAVDKNVEIECESRIESNVILNLCFIIDDYMKNANRSYPLDLGDLIDEFNRL